MTTRSARAVLTAVALVGVAGTPAPGADAPTYPGPYDATVVRVVDGDTIEVSVAVWPLVTVRPHVRVRGIDAPEIRAGDCGDDAAVEALKAWGADATTFVAERYAVGQRIRLRDVTLGSFARRVVATVERPEGPAWADLAEELKAARMAFPDGDGDARIPWCLLAVERGKVAAGVPAE